MTNQLELPKILSSEKQSFYIKHCMNSNKTITITEKMQKNDKLTYLYCNIKNGSYGSSMLTTLYHMHNYTILNNNKNNNFQKIFTSSKKFFEQYSQLNKHIIKKRIENSSKSIKPITRETDEYFFPVDLVKKYKKNYNLKYCSFTGIINNNIMSGFIYNVFKKSTILVNSLLDYSIPSKTFPFCISIDSEFVDKNEDGYDIYENKRLNIPLSLGAQIIFFNDTSLKLYRTYVFNQNEHDYLKQTTIDPFLKDSIRHIDYKPSKCYNFNYYDHTHAVLINDNSVFKDLIHKEVINNVCKLGSITSSLHFIPPVNLINHKQADICCIPILFYFSIKDLKYLFGSETYILIEPYLFTSRRVSFEKYSSISPFAFYYKDSNIEFVFKIKLIDLFGINSNGLYALAKCTNVNVLDNKGALDSFKVDMRQAIIKKPNDFISYQFNDVQALYLIYMNYIKSIHTMYQELNINEMPTIFSNSDNRELKQTIGSITATMFEQFIFSRDPSLKNAIDALGIKVNRSEFQYKDIHLIKGLEMGSAKYLNHLKGSAIEGAFVSGGRCCNETPEELNFKNVLDIDFESCYGNSLRSLLYPIGIPHVLRNPKGGFVCSLGEFFREYKEELVPGCWYAVIGTKKYEEFSFNFDLIVSKIISSQNIEDKIDQPDSMPQNMHLSGSQAIFTKEIKHGIITEDSVELIEKIATSREKGELYRKIYVICASFYPKRKQCDSIEAFSGNVHHHINFREKKKSRKSSKKHILTDAKTNDSPMFWYGLNMEQFVGRLIDKRKELKDNYKMTGKSEYDALQNQLKTVVNTLYGVIASRFFSIGNLTFANNVTNKARSQSWLLSKCFNTKQIITDGGFYEAHKVLDFKSFKKKPGFKTLYELHISKKPADLKHFKPLGFDLKSNFNWDDKFDFVEKNPDFSNYHKFFRVLDKLANRQYKKFCEHFGVTAKYNLEHKTKNISKTGVTAGRGHYYLDSLLAGDNFKVRGTQKPKDDESVASPIYEVLKNKTRLGSNDADIINMDNICYSNKAMVKRFNHTSVKKKLGSTYIENDFSLHSTICSRKTFSYNLDEGRFENQIAFQNVNSSYAKILAISFLNSDCILEIDSNKLTLKADAFWQQHRNAIKQLTSRKKVIRNSKNTTVLRDNLVKNAKIVDSNFPMEISDFATDINDDPVFAPYNLNDES